jgi:hypothetical protein
MVIQKIIHHNLYICIIGQLQYNVKNIKVTIYNIIVNNVLIKINAMYFYVHNVLKIINIG